MRSWNEYNKQFCIISEVSTSHHKGGKHAADRQEDIMRHHNGGKHAADGQEDIMRHHTGGRHAADRQVDIMKYTVQHMIMITQQRNALCCSSIVLLIMVFHGTEFGC